MSDLPKTISTCLCGHITTAEQEKKMREEFKKWIVEEILVAQIEGQPTSRLTSLFNKL